jgi:peptidoglycan hydrolase CwlO-like protein
VRIYEWERLNEKLDAISSQLSDLQQKVNTIVALADDLKASIAKLDTETTAVAANIAAIAAKIHNSMTDAEVAEVQASFQTLGDRLTTLAVDPTVPVPPPPAALKALRKANP